MKVGDAFEVHAGSYLEYDAQNTPKMQSTPLGFIIPQVTVDEVPVFAGRITLLERNEDILRLRFQAQFCLTWKDGACNQPTRHLDFEMDFSVDDLSYQQPPTVARPSPVQEWYDRVFLAEYPQVQGRCRSARYALCAREPLPRRGDATAPAAADPEELRIGRRRRRNAFPVAIADARSASNSKSSSGSRR